MSTLGKWKYKIGKFLTKYDLKDEIADLFIRCGKEFEDEINDVLKRIVEILMNVVVKVMTECNVPVEVILKVKERVNDPDNLPRFTEMVKDVVRNFINKKL